MRANTTTTFRVACHRLLCRKPVCASLLPYYSSHKTSTCRIMARIGFTYAQIFRDRAVPCELGRIADARLFLENDRLSWIGEVHAEAPQLIDDPKIHGLL